MNGTVRVVSDTITRKNYDCLKWKSEVPEWSGFLVSIVKLKPKFNSQLTIYAIDKQSLNAIEPVRSAG